MVSDETKKALQAEVVAVKTRWGDAVKMKKAKDGPQAPLPIAVSRPVQKPASAEVYDVEEITVWLWIETLAPYDGAEKAPIRVEVSAEIPAHVCNVAAEHVCKRWRAELAARGAAKGWMLEKILGWCESAYTDLLVLDPRYVDCYMGINEHGMTIRRYAIQEPPPPEPEPDDDDDDSDYDSDDSDDDGVDDIDSKVKKMGLAEEEERQMRIKLKAEAEADRQYREQRRKEAEEIREQGADGGENGLGDGGVVLLVGVLGEDLLEVGGERGFHVFDCVLENHLAFVEDDDSGADLFDDFEDVGAEEDHFAFGGEDFEETAEEEGGVDVEAGEGFVEDEQFGIVEEGGGEEDALAHAL
jgi:hypothetical protein